MGFLERLLGKGGKGDLADGVRVALRAVTVPGGGALCDHPALSPILANGAHVTFSLTIDPKDAQDWFAVRDAAEKAARSVKGVEKATVVLSAETAAGTGTPASPVHSPGSPMSKAPSASARPAPRVSGPQGLEGVGAIIAVASGKGGVGKSTTTANLAAACAAMGLKVGLLDADVYGPSVPKLFGISGAPEIVSGGKTPPPVAHGIKLMSMGFLVKEDVPVAWRGPMVVSALTQMLNDIAWAPLDILFIDMPPGTGDAQLTLSQKVALSGAVVVSTPQDLALIDARKGLAMFAQVSVPILGIVENMATFICPHCGAASHIFGHGGARAEADKLGVPFLGEIPLAMIIRETSDAGTPITLKEPQGPQALAYRAVAEAMIASLETQRREGKPAPEIIFE